MIAHPRRPGEELPRPPWPSPRPRRTSPDSRGPSELPFEPKTPDYKVALTLDDVDLPDLVRTIGQLTGRRFVVASAHAKGLKATLYAPEKVSVAEAYQAFLAVLQANALTVIPSGAFWKIIDTQDVTKRPRRCPRGRGGDGRRALRHARAPPPSRERRGHRRQRARQVRDARRERHRLRAGNMVILTETGRTSGACSASWRTSTSRAGDKVWLEPLNYVSAAQFKRSWTRCSI